MNEEIKIECSAINCRNNLNQMGFMCNLKIVAISKEGKCIDFYPINNELYCDGCMYLEINKVAIRKEIVKITNTCNYYEQRIESREINNIKRINNCNAYKTYKKK